MPGAVGLLDDGLGHLGPHEDPALLPALLGPHEDPALLPALLGRLGTARFSRG
ncbi:hypothetical protein [Nonomuraea cavernae]|uniref:hypothetical protein n=1 Tax=Nonomuraea cavernae TaxID=2045107 RepID=UPI0016682367|nr:hypothetical protein [Nonomuraea cavernae]MCA2187151.1 hypothetical protein [Nonomuraea cavernae]